MLPPLLKINDGAVVINGVPPFNKDWPSGTQNPFKLLNPNLQAHLYPAQKLFGIDRHSFWDKFGFCCEVAWGVLLLDVIWAVLLLVTETETVPWLFEDVEEEELVDPVELVIFGVSTVVWIN